MKNQFRISNQINIILYFYALEIHSWARIKKLQWRPKQEEQRWRHARLAGRVRSCETRTIGLLSTMPNFWEYVRKAGGGARNHLEPSDQGSGDYSDAPIRATSRREIRDALLHPVPGTDGFRQCRNAVPPSCTGPSTIAFCDRHSVYTRIYV